jgi:glycosyltransferase involved in cell wall biosynthesis
VDNLPAWWPSLDPPVFLFWGLIDQRLDVGWCRHLSESISERGGRGTLVLVGPTQAPDPALETLGHVVMPGPVRYEALPAVARAASVLVMPYADLPVTRAMQPLKLKEYLAAGRAVVVRALPATRPWSDAADVVDSAEGFVEACWRRAEQGLPADQATARRRLAEETWARKARALEAVLLEQPAGSATA